MLRKGEEPFSVTLYKNNVLYCGVELRYGYWQLALVLSSKRNLISTRINSNKHTRSPTLHEITQYSLRSRIID